VVGWGGELTQTIALGKNQQFEMLLEQKQKHGSLFLRYTKVYMFYFVQYRGKSSKGSKSRFHFRFTPQIMIVIKS
jgi:hypothetical protein